MDCIVESMMGKSTKKGFSLNTNLRKYSRKYPLEGSLYCMYLICKEDDGQWTENLLVFWSYFKGFHLFFAFVGDFSIFISCFTYLYFPTLSTIQKISKNLK